MLAFGKNASVGKNTKYLTICPKCQDCSPDWKAPRTFPGQMAPPPRRTGRTSARRKTNFTPLSGNGTVSTDAVLVSTVLLPGSKPN
ncbi:MAG TPA: hypothetical protein QF625_03715 [Candidatus Scalindua sp.]|nr:hypothetical protein [Candidatus Scalindua sp.]